VRGHGAGRAGAVAFLRRLRMREPIAALLCAVLASGSALYLPDGRLPCVLYILRISEPLRAGAFACGQTGAGFLSLPPAKRRAGAFRHAKSRRRRGREAEGGRRARVEQRRSSSATDACAPAGGGQALRWLGGRRTCFRPFSACVASTRHGGRGVIAGRRWRRLNGARVAPCYLRQRLGASSLLKQRVLAGRDPAWRKGSMPDMFFSATFCALSGLPCFLPRSVHVVIGFCSSACSTCWLRDFA